MAEAYSVVKLKSGEDAVVLSEFGDETVDVHVFSGGVAWKGQGPVDSPDRNDVMAALRGSGGDDKHFSLDGSCFKITEGGGDGPVFPLLTAEVQKVAPVDFATAAQKCMEKVTRKVQMTETKNVTLRRDLDAARTETEKLQSDLSKISAEFKHQREDMFSSFLTILNAKKAGGAPHHTATSGGDGSGKKAPSARFDDDEDDDNSSAYNEDTDEEDVVADLDPSQYAKEPSPEPEPVTQTKIVRAAENPPVDDQMDVETVPFTLSDQI